MESFITSIVIITSIAAFFYLLDLWAYVVRKKKRIAPRITHGYYPFITKEQAN